MLEMVLAGLWLLSGVAFVQKFLIGPSHMVVPLSDYVSMWAVSMFIVALGPITWFGALLGRFMKERA